MIVGVGVDECEVARMRAALDRTASMRTRLFTVGEQAYADAAEPGMAAQRYAARFAAKEAVLKALGAGLGACKFTDIEVVRADSGAPSVVLAGAASALAEQAGVARWWISLTHTAERATAFVIAEA